MFFCNFALNHGNFKLKESTNFKNFLAPRFPPP